jgi:hypothetical protein
MLVKGGSVFVTLLIHSAAWCLHFIVGLIWISGPGRVVGIVPAYRLDGPGIESP